MRQFVEYLDQKINRAATCIMANVIWVFIKKLTQMFAQEKKTVVYGLVITFCSHCSYDHTGHQSSFFYREQSLRQSNIRIEILEKEKKHLERIFLCSMEQELELQFEIMRKTFFSTRMSFSEEENHWRTFHNGKTENNYKLIKISEWYPNEITFPFTLESFSQLK